METLTKTRVNDFIRLADVYAKNLKDFLALNSLVSISNGYESIIKHGKYHINFYFGLNYDSYSLSIGSVEYFNYNNKFQFTVEDFDIHDMIKEGYEVIDIILNDHKNYLLENKAKKIEQLKEQLKMLEG